MAATATSRLRLIKQATYDNPETWGIELNTGLIDRVDDALGGVAIPVAGNVTLTVENYIADQARSLFLMLSGAGGFVITAPAVSKLYLVINKCLADVTVTPSAGTGAVIRAGTSVWWYCDGTNGFVVDPTIDKLGLPVGSVNFNGQRLINVAKAVAATDGATLLNRLDEFEDAEGDLSLGLYKILNLGRGSAGTEQASTVKQVEEMIASGASASLPSQIGHAGEFLSTNGTAPSWVKIQPTVISVDTALTAGVVYRVTGLASRTLTLPANPLTGDTIAILDGGSVSDTVIHTINRNGKTIMGLAENLLFNIVGAEITLWWAGTDWRLF